MILFSFSVFASYESDRLSSLTLFESLNCKGYIEKADPQFYTQINTDVLYSGETQLGETNCSLGIGCNTRYKYLQPTGNSGKIKEVYINQLDETRSIKARVTSNYQNNGLRSLVDDIKSTGAPSACIVFAHLEVAKKLENWYKKNCKTADQKMKYNTHYCNNTRETIDNVFGHLTKSKEKSKFSLSADDFYSIFCIDVDNESQSYKKTLHKNNSNNKVSFDEKTLSIPSSFTQTSSTYTPHKKYLDKAVDKYEKSSGVRAIFEMSPLRSPAVCTDFFRELHQESIKNLETFDTKAFSDYNKSCDKSYRDSIDKLAKVNPVFWENNKNDYINALKSKNPREVHKSLKTVIEKDRSKVLSYLAGLDKENIVKHKALSIADLLEYSENFGNVEGGTCSTATIKYGAGLNLNLSMNNRGGYIQGETTIECIGPENSIDELLKVPSGGTYT